MIRGKKFRHRGHSWVISNIKSITREKVNEVLLLVGMTMGNEGYFSYRTCQKCRGNCVLEVKIMTKSIRR